MKSLVDQDGDGIVDQNRVVNRWSPSQTAHMVKLSFPAEDKQKYSFLEIPTYTEQETLTAYQLPRDPGESDWDYEKRIYGSARRGPDDAQFWMEGVRPRKITLEWRLKKGAIDVAYEQTFLAWEG